MCCPFAQMCVVQQSSAVVCLMLQQLQFGACTGFHSCVAVSSDKVALSVSSHSIDVSAASLLERASC